MRESEKDSGKNGHGAHGGENPGSVYRAGCAVAKGGRVKRVKKFPEILDKAGFDLYNCNRSAAH